MAVVLLILSVSWVGLQILYPSQAFVKLIDAIDPPKEYAIGEIHPGYSYRTPKNINDL